MHILKDQVSVKKYLNELPDTELKGLIASKLNELSGYDDYELCQLVHFYVVETADELASLNLPDQYEIREDHTHWTELVYVLSDDGFGLQVYVRKGLI